MLLCGELQQLLDQQEMISENFQYSSRNFGRSWGLSPVISIFCLIVSGVRRVPVPDDIKSAFSSRDASKRESRINLNGFSGHYSLAANTIFDNFGIFVIFSI